MGGVTYTVSCPECGKVYEIDYGATALYNPVSLFVTSTENGGRPLLEFLVSSKKIRKEAFEDIPWILTTSINCTTAENAGKSTADSISVFTKGTATPPTAMNRSISAAAATINSSRSNMTTATISRSAAVAAKLSL